MTDVILDSTVSNSMQLFENEQFGRVRVIMRDGEPWFVAKDVCECLDLSNVSQACSRLDEDETIVLTRDELGSVSNIISNDIRLDDDTVLSNRGLILVSEPGLYSLVGSSKKPEAKAFKRWVNHEVLPSIRKTGSYSVAQPTIYDYARALIAEKERNDALEAENKQLTAERDEAIRTKTQYQSNLASQMSGRVGGLTAALNRVRTENDRLKGDRFTVDDIYIIMNTSDVSFTLKDPKAVIRDSMNLFSKEMGEPFPKLPIKQKEINGKMVDVSGFVYTGKAVQAYFEFVEANPMGWQARNRKMIMYGWLREKLISHI